jgi:hypothetical protein
LLAIKYAIPNATKVIPSPIYPTFLPILASVIAKNNPGRMKLVIASLNAPIIPKTTLRSSTNTEVAQIARRMVRTKIVCYWSLI